MSRGRPLVSRPVWLTALGLAALACSDRPEPEGLTGAPSPNASILPAPLASAGDLAATPARSAAPVREGIPADSAGRLLVREPPPPPPAAAAVNEPLPPDTITLKDTAGVILEAAFRWPAQADAPAVPEVSTAGIQDALKKVPLTVTVGLAAVGRMRLALDSPVFALPAHTELRARTSLLGHVLAWPDGSAYRVLAPGSLRATFAERRADVSPLLRATTTASGAGRLLGKPTERVVVETTLGKVTLEQAPVEAVGEGGALLCRLLVELVGASPETEACSPGRVPLAAEYRWVGGGSFGFSVKGLTERKDMPVGPLHVPPAGAAFRAGELPPPSSPVFLSLTDLSRLRSKPGPRRPPSTGAPGEGITAENRADRLVYLLLDGVPVAAVPAGGSVYVIGPLAGRYNVGFRDFLGERLEPSRQVDLPALVQFGAAPSGDPPPP